jgi:ABC-type ATPase involved in cell division
MRNESAVEHVALPLLSDGMSLRAAKAPAHAALARLGVADCAYVPLDDLSRVERIRVDLAQALVHHPRVLLVDEPSALLSPTEAVDLYGQLRALGADSRLAIVVASEDVAPIRKAQRMLSIDCGRLRSMDHPGTVVQLRDPRHRPRTHPPL